MTAKILTITVEQLRPAQLGGKISALGLCAASYNHCKLPCRMHSRYMASRPPFATIGL
jgi:hypothetical protein